MTRRHIIFDLGGTLVDTERAIAAFTAEIAAAHGCAFPVDHIQHHYINLGDIKGKYALIGRNAGRDIPDEELEAMTRAHIKRKEAMYAAPGLALMPGARAALSALQAGGDTVSLGSSNPTTRSIRALSGTRLLPFFEDRVFGPDLTGGINKPDPAIFRLAARAVGSTPSNTSVVGNSVADMLAGKAAGFFTIGLVDPALGEGEMAMKKEKQLRDAGADAIIRHHDELSTTLPQHFTPKPVTPKPEARLQPEPPSPYKKKEGE